MIILFSLIPTLICFDYKGILNRDLHHIRNELINGSLIEGRLSIKDVENLFTELEKTTSLVHSQQIGQSYLNKTIYSYSLCSNFTQQKPMMLITSLHHSREVASLQMNIYLFLYILWEVEHEKNPFYINMITHNCILIVPFVNIDGYSEIEAEFNKRNLLPKTRKNLNRTILCSEEGELAGVDINRNYGYQFAYDNIGSSDDPCDEAYRGSVAFSEKETQAIKYVVENYNVKMAMNLHSFGNKWLLPYSYGKEELDKDGIPYKIYEDFKQNGRFQGHYKIGHAQELIQYTANGEAADWMLSKGIIAICPELGEQTYSNILANFFPDQEKTLQLFQTEFPPLIDFINYLPFKPVIKNFYQYSQDDVQRLTKTLSENQYLVDIECVNQGVSSGSDHYFVVSDTVQLIEAYYIEMKYDRIYDRDKIQFNILNKIEFENNTISTFQFSPRSKIIYFLILQEIQNENEMKFYFDLNGIDHENTFTLKDFHQMQNKQKMHFNYIFYIGLMILLAMVIAILLKIGFRKQIIKKHQNITELIEQKPEQIELHVQMMK
ncbi:unnamed protein product (macronuclear) [Paramecium tetraurelia]|uniref:Peptidase M14 domain-containing protein n=1 Tax=Paramecium tetraurelia TaxID=5888 RepID=A0D2L5_PARTE|nr:uncharacterized protein GSPATT00012790001 [Paramecium tetraurelia]CAK77282.1 unnamed protein product [Paramecium tetraurelia]|eukprot:XP_001444679.1 hypothetical protein (macronuclear) [Paramecium tetraurelia strain d4-2]